MSGRLTDEELDEIKARCDAATPGPWVEERDEDSLQAIVSGEEDVIGAWCDPGGGDFGPAISDEDASFIAHAREDIPALLAEVERLRKRVEWAEGHMRAAQEQAGGLFDRARDADARVAELEAAMGTEVGRVARLTYRLGRQDQQRILEQIRDLAAGMTDAPVDFSLDAALPTGDDDE